jgi:hypothetical protein
LTKGDAVLTLVKAVLGKPLTVKKGVNEFETLLGQAKIKCWPAPFIEVYVFSLIDDNSLPEPTPAPVKLLITVSVATDATIDAEPGLVVRLGLPILDKLILPQYILFFQVKTTDAVLVKVPSLTDILKVLV